MNDNKILTKCTFNDSPLFKMKPARSRRLLQLGSVVLISFSQMYPATCIAWCYPTGTWKPDW